MEVLIVDDASFMRMMLRQYLTNAGHQVIGEASNGLQAIDIYKELKPELVIMDITMPEMEGIEAVKEIKKIDPQAKILMCSAMGQQTMVIEAIRAGALDFIVKPFQEERVVEALNNVTL